MEICEKKTYLYLIPLSIFWVIWEERNVRAFGGIEGEILNIRNKWIHVFGSLILSHNINKLENFGNVIDLLTDM